MIATVRTGQFLLTPQEADIYVAHMSRYRDRGTATGSWIRIYTLHHHDIPYLRFMWWVQRSRGCVAVSYIPSAAASICRDAEDNLCPQGNYSPTLVCSMLTTPVVEGALSAHTKVHD